MDGKCPWEHLRRKSPIVGGAWSTEGGTVIDTSIQRGHLDVLEIGFSGRADGKGIFTASDLRQLSAYCLEMAEQFDDMQRRNFV